MNTISVSKMQLFALLLMFVAMTVSVSAASQDFGGRKKIDGDFEFADEEETKPSKKEGKKTWILDPGSDLCQALKCKKKELCLLEDEFTAVCVSKKELHKSGDVIVPKSKLKDGGNKLSDDSKEYDEDEDDDSDYYDDDLDSGEGDDTAFFTDDKATKTAKSKPANAEPKQSASTSPAASTSSSSTAYRACSPCPVVKPTFLCGSDNRTYSSLCRLDYHNCIQNSHITVVCKGFCPCKDQDELAKKKKAEAERMNRFIQKYKQSVKLEQEQGDDAKVGKYRPRFMKNSAKQNGKLTNAEKADGSKVFGSNNDYASGVPVAPSSPTTSSKSRFYASYKDYSAVNKKVSSNKQRSYNDVLNNKPFLPRDCNDEALESMGNRLLDWFSVVMADNLKRRAVRRRGSKQVFPTGCKPEVMWMFQHLNSDEDSQLSLQELYDLENDRNEKCIKPFIDQCDTNKDIFISPEEWCHCFAKSDRPCTAVRRKASGGLLGSYMPQCDVDGYYKSTQCHSSIGLCWCVDKHGVEFANTRTRGKPSCGSFSARDENDMDDDDDTDIEGSSDGPLEI